MRWWWCALPSSVSFLPEHMFLFLRLSVLLCFSLLRFSTLYFCLSCRCCYCCCFCFSFLLVVEGMRRDGCDGERERRERGREDTKSWSWMQMAKTQKNKATAHHLGLLKVISYLDTLRQSRVCGARMLIMMIQLGFFFFLSLYQRHNVCDFLAGRCCGFFFCLLRCSFVHVSHQWLIDWLMAFILHLVWGLQKQQEVKLQKGSDSSSACQIKSNSMNLAATLNPFGLLCGRQSLPNCAGRFWHHLQQREEVLEKVLMLPRVGTHELDWLGFLLLASPRFSTNLQEHFLRWALPYLTCLLCLHIMVHMLWHVLVMTTLMTTLVVMLPSKYCCRDFSTTLIEMLWHANCNGASFCNDYPPVDGPWSSVRLALLLIPLFLFSCLFFLSYFGTFYGFLKKC